MSRMLNEQLAARAEVRRLMLERSQERDPKELEKLQTKIDNALRQMTYGLAVFP